MFRIFGVQNKKIGSKLRISEQIRFSELYRDFLPEAVSCSKG
ncbi:MAG: hypothetical protein ACMUEL_09265 [Flavobacteriales bacterium Tduv]